MKVYDGIIEDYQASEIAEDLGISEEEAAKKYFEETFEPDNFTEENIKYKEFVDEVPYINCDLYHDYGAGYYFLVKKEENNIQENKKVMKESQLREIIKESLKQALNESAFDGVEEMWDNLINYNIATEDELRLVTDICGYSTDTLNDVLYARTGYRNWEQYAGEEGIEDEEEFDED